MFSRKQQDPDRPVLKDAAVCITGIAGDELLAVRYQDDLERWVIGYGRSHKEALADLHARWGSMGFDETYLWGAVAGLGEGSENELLVALVRSERVLGRALGVARERGSSGAAHEIESEKILARRSAIGEINRMMGPKKKRSLRKSS